MDPDDAKEYASRSSMHALLVIFVQKLEHTILCDRDFDDQHRAKKIVDEVWHKFDVDKSGTIEWNDTKLLVSVMRWDKDGQGDDPTDEEAKRFLQSMDTNGDGVLDRGIYCFCSKCTYYERRTSSHFRTTEPNAC